MKIFRPGFFHKLIIILLLFVQFAIIITGIVLGFVYAFAFSVVVPVILVLYVLNFITALYIFNSSSPDAYKLSWLMAVLFLPVGGLIMYLAFANKQTRKKQKKIVDNWLRPLENVPSPEAVLNRLGKAEPNAVPVERYLYNAKGGGVFENTSVDYYPLVDRLFPDMLQAVSKAKHYIYIEVFILEYDGYFWETLHEILKVKVQEGLDVKIIYDDLGSLRSAPAGYDMILRREGIDARVFNHFRPFIDVRQNNRDHRKMIIIDGHTCFTGGFNIADEYINRRERFGHWKDNGIKVVGEAVTSYTMMFIAAWQSSFGHEKQIDRDIYSAKAHIDEIGGFPKTNGFVQPYCDIPFDEEAVGQRVYLQLIQRATKYIYITTPYLIIDREIENSLITAAKSGIDVRIITPHIPDKKAIFQLTRSHYGTLLKAGVRIYEYIPGFIHAKTFLVDGTMGTIGTINLDFRSLFLHMENGTFMVHTPCLADMKADFEDTFLRSYEVNYGEWNHWAERKWLLWSFLSVFAPFV